MAALSATPFALRPGEAQDLVDGLLAGADDGDARYRAFVLEPGDDAALLAPQVAAEVFDEAFGNGPDLLAAEYGELLPTVTSVVVVDAVQRAALGALLMQAGPVEELKTVVDLAGPPWSMPARPT